MESCKLLGFSTVCHAICTECFVKMPHRLTFEIHEALNGNAREQEEPGGTVQAEPRNMERVDPTTELGKLHLPITGAGWKWTCMASHPPPAASSNPTRGDESAGGLGQTHLYEYS